MKCKICGNGTDKKTEQLVLQKHRVSYYECKSCHFVQTEKPHWLNEAYQNVITSLDIGLISRNQYLLDTIPNIIDTAFPNSRTFVDYGGGYGMFVRMMRDIGYDYYRQDIHCENLFAKHFDLADAPAKIFDVLTAFEVFEHLEDPVSELEKMFGLSKNIILSTELNDKHLSDFENWWYLAPETGQHIAFYHSKTFAYLAGKFDKHYYTNGHNLHILSDKAISGAALKKIFPIQKSNRLARKVKSLFVQPSSSGKRKSLLQSDYEFIKKKLKGKE